MAAILSDRSSRVVTHEKKLCEKSSATMLFSMSLPTWPIDSMLEKLFFVCALNGGISRACCMWNFPITFDLKCLHRIIAYSFEIALNSIAHSTQLFPPQSSSCQRLLPTSQPNIQLLTLIRIVRCMSNFDRHRKSLQCCKPNQSPPI